MAKGERKFFQVYENRANRAEAANDLERCMSNYELALPHGREAVRIFRLCNHIGRAERTLSEIALIEGNIRKIGIAKAAAAAATTAAPKG